MSLDDRFKALAELLQRATDTAGVHLEKITSVEKQVVVLVDLKGSVGYRLHPGRSHRHQERRREPEVLQGLKKKNSAKSRRGGHGHFCLNLLAAIVGGLISLGIGLLIWWLNKPK